jgi:hypothetical protein
MMQFLNLIIEKENYIGQSIVSEDSLNFIIDDLYIKNNILHIIITNILNYKYEFALSEMSYSTGDGFFIYTIHNNDFVFLRKRPA